MRSRIQGRNFAETLIPLDPKAFFNDTLGSEMLLANIDSLIQSQNFDEALRILEITVKGIEEGTNQLFGGKKYTDDSINEYHHFDNPLEVFLYLRLCQPAKQIKQIPENYARLYMRYGCVCMELKRYGEARTALQKALRWNPIKVSILFELAETYKIEKKLDKFREITVKCFHYAYTSQDLARCYRNLGYYYIERQDYDLAVALFNYSLFWAESPMGRNELVYIAQMTGKAIVAPSAKESQRLFETHKIPLRPDLTILNIVTGLAAGAKKEHEIDAANFFHSILDNLQPEHARFTKGNVSEGEPAKKRGRLKADKQDKGSGKITQTAVKPTTGFREYIDEISGKYNTLLSKTPADSKVIMDNLEEIVFAITVFGASFYSM
ncbi:MAG: tetratricopeptide repeat protein, partial [Synergistaceae bacterium]|nr:tetratricopeptide repeat protein [Synergistaceae bacterium]